MSEARAFLERIKQAEAACEHPSWTCLYCGAESREDRCDFHHRRLEIAEARIALVCGCLLQDRITTLRAAYEQEQAAHARATHALDAALNCLAARGAENARLRAVVDAVRACEYGLHPRHAHDVPGVWDASNGPPLGGTPCADCAAWARLDAALDAAIATKETSSDLP